MSDYSRAVCALTPDAPSPTRVTAGVSWLLPGFGTAVFAVALFQVLFVSSGATSLFRDSDAGWHIRNGENILNAAQVPRSDSFSYTRNGRPWYAWEWLTDVALGASHRLAGPAGVAFLAGSSIALTIWAAARFTLFLGGNLFLTAGAMVLLMGTTSIHWLARPHIFSWPLSLLFLFAAERERVSPSRTLWLLPLLSCLWANVHGSFLLGPVILMVYAAGACLEHRSLSAGARFGASTIATLLATLFNPYGWNLHAHVVSYLSNTYLMDHIAEFRSFSFHSPGAWYVEGFLLVAVLGAVAQVKQRAYAHALLAAGLLHMALYSARHLPTAAVLLLPLAVAALTREARSWSALRPLLSYSDNLRTFDVQIRGVVPAAAVLLLAGAGLSTLAGRGEVGFSPDKFPVRSAQFLEHHVGRGHVFTKDQWGGYLIYHFAGQTPVFLDGRSDFYGADFLETYAVVAEARPGWSAVLERYDVRFVLVPVDHAMASVLEISPAWKRIHKDDLATVFERRDPA